MDRCQLCYLPLRLDRKRPSLSLHYCCCWHRMAACFLIGPSTRPCLPINIDWEIVFCILCCLGSEGQMHFANCTIVVEEDGGSCFGNSGYWKYICRHGCYVYPEFSVSIRSHGLSIYMYRCICSPTMGSIILLQCRCESLFFAIKSLLDYMDFLRYIWKMSNCFSFASLVIKWYLPVPTKLLPQEDIYHMFLVCKLPYRIFII